MTRNFQKSQNRLNNHKGPENINNATAKLGEVFYSSHIDYCPLDITRKDIFCLAFYYMWKYFVLIDKSYQKPFVLLVSVVCSQICIHKIKSTSKNWSGLCNFYIKVIFWNFVQENIFYLFCWILIIDVSQQYCKNFRKIEQAECVKNLPPRYLPYRLLHNLHLFSQWEKVKKFDFFKNQ